MHESLPLFLKLIGAPIVGFLSSSGIVVATAQIGDESTVTLGFLLTVVAVIVTVFLAVGAGVWKLASTLGELRTTNNNLIDEVEQAREDRGKMFEKLDQLNRDFASFSASCPAVNSNKCTASPFK